MDRGALDVSAGFGRAAGTLRTRGSLFLAPRPVPSPGWRPASAALSVVAAASPWRRGLLTALAAGVVLSAHLVDPAWVAAGPILCPVRRLTGIPCPGCGMTRAAVALAHGDLASAVAFHPLSPLVALAAVAALVAYVRSGHLPRVPAGMAAAGVVLVMAVWAVRLATGFGPV